MALLLAIWERKIAVTLCVLLPYLIAYIAYRHSKPAPMRFSLVVLVFFAFATSLVILSFLVAPDVLAYFNDPQPWRSLLSLSFSQLLITAFFFPGFVFVVFVSFLAIFTPDTRPLVVLLWGGAATLLHLVNLVTFLADIDLMKL